MKLGHIQHRNCCLLECLHFLVHGPCSGIQEHQRSFEIIFGKFARRLHDIQLLTTHRLRAIISHVRFHLQIYVAMQRLDLIPGSRWFPSLNFFIPFSSASPLVAPPPLGSSGARTLSEWTGKIAMSLAPYAGYWLIGCAWDVFSYFIRRKVHRNIPHPWPSSITNLRALVPTSTPGRQSFPESPTLGDTDREIRHTQGPEADATRQQMGKMSGKVFLSGRFVGRARSRVVEGMIMLPTKKTQIWLILL